jgi:drug/metabolite transporter (DMT)-like permease
MSSNPYSDNQPVNPYSIDQLGPGGPQPGDGYVKQISLVGILNIVQASLELLMALMLGGIAIFMGTMATDPKFIEQMDKSNVSAQFMTGIYIVIGVVVGLVALVRLVAGIMTLRRRGRILAIVSSIIGLCTVFTCYCSLTSVAIAVYTLVVLVQPSVIAEYQRVRSQS